MLSSGKFVPSDGCIRPTYSIYQYTDQIYKIVHFKRSPLVSSFGSSQPVDDSVKHDSKLDASLSRARRSVLELALCNPWMYFCTFTISPDKFDRHDLSSFDKKFKQFLRDFRKSSGVSLPFVLVPEQHKDGSWHMHGLFGADITPFLKSFHDVSYAVPRALLDGDFYTWDAYSSRFGFCSFGLIRDPVACAFYITKYVTKDLSDSAIPVGMHLYSCSRGLNRATKHGDIYGNSAMLDGFCTQHYDFCDTGMTFPKDGCDWSFAFEYMDFSDIDSLDPYPVADDSYSEYLEKMFDNYYEAVQLQLGGSW